MQIQKHKIMKKHADNIEKSFPVTDSDFKVAIKTGKHSFCVQVAIKTEGVALRDSKDPEKQTLFFTHKEWDAFTDGVKNGEFEPLERI